MPALHTAETKFRAQLEDLVAYGVIAPDRPADIVTVPRHIGGWAAGHLARPVEDMTTAPLMAFVNCGRWLVQCECASAQFAFRADPRFWCVECCNANHGGRWRPVVWPKETDAIEHALCARPMTDSQNWRPGETVADLRRQSAENGVGNGLD